MLRLRREEIVPRLEGIPGGDAEYRIVGESGLRVRWTLGDDSTLTLLANLGDEPLGGFGEVTGDLIYATEDATEGDDALSAWSVAWYLEKNG